MFIQLVATLQCIAATNVNNQCARNQALFKVLFFFFSFFIFILPSLLQDFDEQKFSYSRTLHQFSV